MEKKSIKSFVKIIEIEKNLCELKFLKLDYKILIAK